MPVSTAASNDMVVEYNPHSSYNLFMRDSKRLPLNSHHREHVYNSMEADAENIHVLPSRAPFPGSGAKVIYTDDGHGMTPEDMWKYQASIGKGICDDRGNFHNGGRLSTMWFNAEGMVIASWTEDTPDGAFIIIKANHDEQRMQWTSSDSNGGIGPVPKEWQFLKSPIIQKAGHGTSVMLLGNDIADDTWCMHYMSTSRTIRSSKGMSHLSAGWFATKFYSPQSQGRALKATIRVGQGAEGDRKWLPEYPTSDIGHVKDVRITPLKELIEKEVDGARGGKPFIELSGTHPLNCNGKHVADVHYVVMFEDRYTDMKYRALHAVFGELYEGEVYNLHYQSNDEKSAAAGTLLSRYGIRDANLQRRMILLVEPKGEVTPTTERSHLFLKDVKDDTLPHTRWGTAFADTMPEELFKLQRIAPKSESRDIEVANFRKYDSLRELSFASTVRSVTGDKVIRGKEGIGAVSSPGTPDPEEPRGSKNRRPRGEGRAETASATRRKSSSPIEQDSEGQLIRVTAGDVAKLEPPSVELASDNDANRAMFEEGGDYEGKLVANISNIIFVINDMDPWFTQAADSLLKIESKRSVSKVKRAAARIAVVDMSRKSLMSHVGDAMNRIYAKTGGMNNVSDSEWQLQMSKFFDYDLLYLRIVGTNEAAMAVQMSR